MCDLNCFTNVFKPIHSQVDNEDVKNGALAVVEMMNERLTSNGVGTRCAKLELKRVISALLITSKVEDKKEDINAGQRFTIIKTLEGKDPEFNES